MTDKAHAEFERLIGDLADARDEDDQGRIRKAIWDRFGTTGAAFVSDMANFSSTSRSLGITHFLKLIHRKRRIVALSVLLRTSGFRERRIWPADEGVSRCRRLGFRYLNFPEAVRLKRFFAPL